jgi:imidazoleglycerol phosphate dehydratase HisB
MEDTNKPLFVSVDRVWNNSQIHVFQFMLSVDSEARATIATLLPYLQHLFGDSVSRHFTAQCVVRNKDAYWDDERKEVVTNEDKYIEEAFQNE